MGKRKQAKQVRRIARSLREDSNIPQVLEAWQIDALAWILWQSGIRYKKIPREGL